MDKFLAEALRTQEMQWRLVYTNFIEKYIGFEMHPYVNFCFNLNYAYRILHYKNICKVSLKYITLKINILFLQFNHKSVGAIYNLL